MLDNNYKNVKSFFYTKFEFIRCSRQKLYDLSSKSTPEFLLNLIFNSYVRYMLHTVQNIYYNNIFFSYVILKYIYILIT